MTRIHIPVALLILDGWGIGDPSDPSNAIARASTPHMTMFRELYPNTRLACSGEAVGLPAGQMGNSEVGHLNIGAGRVVYQELTRIGRSIQDGSFFKNPALEQAMQHAKGKNGTLHLMGLLSDGGVHSHLDHLTALLEMAKRENVAKVCVHAFLDGRDVPPKSASAYIAACEKQMKRIGLGRIATISGRYYAMDRDQRWERVEKAYAALAYGEGKKAPSAQEALEQAYARGETDEFVQPTVMTDADGTVRPGDAVIFFNFRPDRARQITRAFIDAEFKGFTRRNGCFSVKFVCMTCYDATFAVPVAFPVQTITGTLGETFSRHQLRQLRIAETEKYAHVTFFFNGGEEKPLEGENRILVPSPKVATYDLQPEMSAPAVTEAVLREINQGKYDLIVLNFANGDMVGHTGNLEAAIQAVQTVDECVGKIVAAIRAQGGVALITADHGNAEQMRDPQTGVPFTAHTTNKVPFILVSERHKTGTLRQNGILADIAPTILEIAGLPVPEEMTGKSLLQE